MKRKPIRRVSKKHKAELEKYYRLREVFLRDNPVCDLCNLNKSTDVHHKKGRGKYLNVVETWMAVDRKCHDTIHENPNQARVFGWLLT